MALFRRKRAPEEERGQTNPYSLQQFASDLSAAFTYGGLSYPVFTMGMPPGDQEDPNGFEQMVAAAYGSNGIVFACMVARMMIFSDVRFAFRKIRDANPGELVVPTDGRNPGSAGLQLLRRPWYGGTTGDLLARMEQDVSIAGNAFVARRQGQLVRLRPDWVSIVAETPPDASLWHPDSQVLGYIYKPGGNQTDEPPVRFLREEVAHYAPYPDPAARFRGVSWLQSVWTEIASDKAATAHKRAFFSNGATVNLIMEYPPETKKEMFDFAVAAFKEGHEGAANAYKTLHVLGATARPVGADMQQMDFKQIQGAGETRIAAASGVGPVITFLSEGLQGSALNAGNYSSARRNVADRTIRPLWRNVCGSLATIIGEPAGTELWYDDREVAFIREDLKDSAEARQIDAATIKSLVDSGFTPESSRDAVIADDMSILKHTGLVSVQLSKPGESNPKTNGQMPLPMMQPQPAGAKP